MQMRRKEREISREEALEIIDQSQYGILTTNDPNQEEPLALPLSLVRKGDKIFFHSAIEGRKTEVLHDGKKVTLVFTGHVQVPDLYTNDQIDKIISQPDKAAPFLASNVFTTAFESAIVTGEVKELREPEEKIGGLALICQKYTPDKMQYFKGAAEASLSRVKVYEIAIDSVRGKRKKIL